VIFKRKPANFTLLVPPISQNWTRYRSVVEQTQTLSTVCATPAHWFEHGNHEVCISGLFAWF